ncbi:MAG: hypothetical protein AB8E15_08840 [Bdellovibrionales bacterium]
MLQLSCPSKSFLIGEYAVLEGGHGIVVGTGPRFVCKASAVSEGDESSISGVSPAGPAMDFLKDNLECFSKWKIQMEDPHNGGGGFGWSSAQFLFLYTLNEMVKSESFESLPDINPSRLLEDFLRYSWDGEGWAPSGLDILSQLEGGILNIQSPRKVEDGKLRPIEMGTYDKLGQWPFDDIQFVLMRTGNKIATHTHLSNLDSIGSSILGKLSEDAGSSLLDKNEESFISSINDFREALRDQDLVDPSSWNFQTQILQRPEVLAIKGCGALGADVILAVVVSELLVDFEEWANEADFQIVANSKEIQLGLTVG